jgi:glycosyltransferase involved in cell wall biosynthesis
VSVRENSKNVTSRESLRTLYVSYFGLREPLVQTQVLPYLRQLVAGGIGVSLLTFEPRLKEDWTTEQILATREELNDEGISWHCLKYHKWPSLPATLYDIVVGTRKVIQIMRREKINVLHARNHVPALMGAIAKKLRGGYLVFDIRGFMPEEYTDGGVWAQNGYLYRGLKRVERYLFAVSDAFVVLTEKARDILFPGRLESDSQGRPFEVIPCCVDFERFDAFDKTSKDSLRSELNVTGRRVIVYLGSFGGWYMSEQITEFLATANEQDPSTFSLVLTQSDPQSVTARLNELGIQADNFSVAQVSPEEVPRYLKAADIAISFVKPCYSKQSSSPTKIAEYLASGLPIVCNTGIGDVDNLISENRAGVLVKEFTRDAYLEALTEVDLLRGEESSAERLRAVARRLFDVANVGRTKYVRLYQRLRPELISEDRGAQVAATKSR